MLLKTPDNRDQGRIVQRVEKKLRPKADAVLYGFFGTVIKELMRGLMAVLRRRGDHESFGVASVRDTPVSRRPAGFSGFVLFTLFRRFVARHAGDILQGATFYPGNGVTPPAQVQYQPIPVPNQLRRQSFARSDESKGPSLPYIPSGSFAKSMLIEGADANASVTGNESTVPMQLRITGRVEMPNSKSYDLTGCFIGLEAWGDVSSERAIVRTRNISCLKHGVTIDQPIAGHVSFRGKNGIKGEVVMRNGKILGWAWGAGFVDGIGQGVQTASQPSVGLGATASLGAGDVMKMGIGGGASKAAQTLSDYYIKRAEQYHPVIPIGAGNEVTVVFQDGFQLKTIEELAHENDRSKAEGSDRSPVPPPSVPQGGMNGFSTDQMLNQLGRLNQSSLCRRPTHNNPT
ncbi:unnamed protein product [Callosobruchus maculatus]|uniref:Conjugal transfer protein TraB n=1 Tax=Callosobruchus maculatus TaxID=64391 RepID=A0A653CIN1_CALMS|nr:unnamed protein product [Callosobruchus maculatus]